MYRKLSLLIPTRGRVALLVRMLASVSHTIGTAHDLEIVFRIDDDDHETRDFLKRYGWIYVERSRLNGYESMPVFFNELAAASTGDVLMCGNDDMIFKSKAWSTEILQAANRYKDGLFDLGVSTFNETHFPFPIVSRKAVNAMGFLCDPAIFWCDIFLRDVMARFDRCEMIDHVKIAHEWAGVERIIEHKYPQYWKTMHAPAVERAVMQLESLRSEAHV